jgi:UDP-glucose 4-epimerase
MSEPLHRVVVTGASGFVGRALLGQIAASVDTISFGAADWRTRLDSAHLEGATIFHLAARVHQPRGGDEDEFDEDNAGKTRVLAEEAAREGAHRLVFLSSIKVNGEETAAHPFTPADFPVPEDAYGRSKLAAERALAEIAAASGLAFTIVRPPLVFGAGARANLGAIVRLADSPWPLPFARLHAPRSFIHVDDLARLLVACAESPQAAGKTYIAAHPQPFSVALLVARLRIALGRKPRLWEFDPGLLERMAALAGQGARVRRLTRPLLCDPSAAERELGWIARVPIDQAVEELVRDYRARGGN